MYIVHMKTGKVNLPMDFTAYSMKLDRFSDEAGWRANPRELFLLILCLINQEQFNSKSKEVPHESQTLFHGSNSSVSGRCRF